MSSETYINDHADQALARLGFQFKNATNLRGLVTAEANQTQDDEDALEQLYMERWIDTAEGAQLDGLGEIVGESRQGRDDEAYVAALKFQILVNTSKGRAEDIIAALMIMTSTPYTPARVQYWEIQPAKVRLLTTGLLIPDNLHEVMGKVTGGGVGIDAILCTFGVAIWNKPLVLRETKVSASSISGAGLSELNIATGTLLYKGGYLSEVV